MLPDGWKIQVVGALFEVQLGKMLNKAAKEKEPQVRYLTNFNVRWGSFDTSRLNTMYFSEREQEKFSLKSGDIIMCEGGDVGRCAIWLGTDFPCYYQKALHRLRTKGDILPEYFQAYMTSIAGSKLLDDYTSRTSIAHLTREKLVELPVKVPPLLEQKKIAQILSTWDNAISATERLLENSQQRKKALMQQLLTGKKRLPGFEGEWTVNSIEKVFAITRGGVQETVEKGKYDLIVMGSISEKGRLIIKNRTNSNLNLLSVNDLVMPERDIGNGLIIGRTVIIEKNDQYVLGPNVLRLRLKNNQSHSAMFWNFLFNTYHVRKEVKKITSGTSQLMITGKDVKRLSVYIPVNPSEQQAIANVLTTADQEIDALQKRLGHLKQEKKALMQQLLTGKRRVQVDAAA